MRTAVFFLLTLHFAAIAADVPITNNGGRWWRDVDARPMVLFPNSLLKIKDTYYLYGEWCFSDESSGINALRCYTSKDFARWKFAGNVLTQQDSHLVNRGTVIYNEATRKYVYAYKFRRPMRFPGWAFGDGIMAFAASSSPTGRFQVVHKDPRTGIVAGDTHLFKDADGRAYLIADGTYAKDEGKRLNIYELNPDYCGIARRVADLGTGYEAANIAKMKGKYWVFASGLNDWYFSPSSYRTADSLAGPWSPWTKLETDPPSADSYNTQFGRLFEVHGHSGSFVIATGNRYWSTIPVAPLRPEDSAPPGVPPAALWLPLQWEGDVPFLRHYNTWYIDAAAGTWAADERSPANRRRQRPTGAPRR